MRVLLVRHGDAVDEAGVLGDADRYLTPLGRRLTLGVGQKITELGVRLDRIITSPLVRAVQTAEILAYTQGYERAVEVWPELAPERARLSRSLLPLDEAGEHEVYALVGHEPSMQAFAAHLLGVPSFPSFQKSGACLIRRSAGGAGAFQWMLHPKKLTLSDSLDALDL